MSEKKEYRTEDEYIIIGDVDGGCGYDWSVVGAVYHPGHKAYYLYEDGGCSCSYPYENYWGGSWDPDSRPMSKQELITEINKYRSDDPYADFDLSEVIELAQAVREFNPKDL